MVTNTRRFLREFAACKARARRGETVRVRDKEGEFWFAAAMPRASLLGAARGRLHIQADLTQPTLPVSGWQPSL